MIWWWTAAWAGPVDPWAGTWGLDPAESDDPGERLRAAVTAPIVSGGRAASMAPDGGASSAGAEDERSHALDDAFDLLGCSGGIELRPAGDGLSVAWTGEAAVVLPLTRRWVKHEREAHRWKVRAWRDGPNLVVERRQRATSVAETFLPTTAPDEVVVVVWVEGPSLHPPVEFRRVYRTIGAPEAPAP